MIKKLTFAKPYNVYVFKSERKELVRPLKTMLIYDIFDFYTVYVLF